MRIRYCYTLLFLLLVSSSYAADAREEDAPKNPLIGVWLRLKTEPPSEGHQIFTVRNDGTAIIAFTDGQKALLDGVHPYTINYEKQFIRFKGVDFYYEVKLLSGGRVKILTLKDILEDGTARTQKYRLITDYLINPANKSDAGDGK